MNNTKITNHKGSILLMSVILMTFLIFLLGALINTTIICYKLKSSQHTYTYNGYMSESGLDEGVALAFILYNNVLDECIEIYSNLYHSTLLTVIDLNKGHYHLSETPLSKYIIQNGLDCYILSEQAIRKDFEDFFIKTFDDEFNKIIKNYQSVIDSYIRLSIIKEQFQFNEGRSQYYLQSSYNLKNVPRKHQITIKIAPPELSDTFISCSKINFEICHWRILYGY